RDDPDEPAVRIENGQPAHLALAHDGERVLERIVLAAREEGGRHDVADPQLGGVSAVDDCAEDDVAVGQNAVDGIAGADQHGADVVLGHDGGRFLHRGFPRHELDLAAHHVGDSHEESPRLARAARGQTSFAAMHVVDAFSDGFPSSNGNAIGMPRAQALAWAPSSNESCGTNELRSLAPPRVPTELFHNASAAVARLEDIYQRNTAFLRAHFEAYASGEELECRVRAFYPLVRITTE